jgi:glutathione S-transferase
MKLCIANKNYSSWSMRSWVLLRQFGIPFEEIKLEIDDFSADSHFKRKLSEYTPTGRVPVLIDGDLIVWDSLAIAEYLADKYPAHELWPSELAAKARARSICAEMHSGFVALRTHFGMNIEASLLEVGSRVLRDEPGVRDDIARIDAMWSELLCQHGGPMLFGKFCIADAFYAPIAARFRTYGVPLSVAAQAYVDDLHAMSAVVEWCRDALAEGRFLPLAEPYRSDRSSSNSGAVAGTQSVRLRPGRETSITTPERGIMNESPGRQAPKLSLVSSAEPTDRLAMEHGIRKIVSPPRAPAASAMRPDVAQQSHDPNWVDTIPLPLPVEPR